MSETIRESINNANFRYDIDYKYNSGYGLGMMLLRNFMKLVFQSGHKTKMCSQ